MKERLSPFSKRALIHVLLLLLVIALAACNTNGNQGTGNGNGQGGQGQEGQLGMNRTGSPESIGTGRHANTRVEVSQAIADKLANMEEIETANVLITDRNAYIAVEMKEGVDSQIGIRERNGVDTGNRINGRGRMQHDTGSGNQAVTENGRDVVTGDSGDGRNERVRMDGNMSRQPSDTGLGLQRDRTGNRSMTDADRYAGEDWTNYTISDQIKDRIADEVRSVAPQVQNVFVSANPDFMERVNGWIDEMENGRPVRGLVKEFNTMVERMFPENR